MDKPQIKGMHAFVSGRVQGVCFRAFVQRSATSLGLTGWVKNIADGRVELTAYGYDEQLSQLKTMLHEGPRAANVTSVEISDAPIQIIESFNIVLR